MILHESWGRTHLAVLYVPGTGTADVSSMSTDLHKSRLCCKERQQLGLGEVVLDQWPENTSGQVPPCDWGGSIPAGWVMRRRASCRPPEPGPDLADLLVCILSVTRGPWHFCCFGSFCPRRLTSCCVRNGFQGGKSEPGSDHGGGRCCWVRSGSCWRRGAAGLGAAMEGRG